VGGMQWFEDEDFWRTFYPHIFSDRRLAAAPGEIDQALQLSGISRGAALDLCCGPGRHLVPLVQKGFEVTGVDRSPFLLGKARERTTSLRVELVEADMRDFVRANASDLILSLFTFFGYFDTRERDLEVLGKVRASLKKDGVFLIDLMGAEVLASLPCHTRWEQAAGGDVFVDHSEILPGSPRLRGQWLLVKGARAIRYEFELNLYSGQEIAGLLERAGFSSVQIFGALDGRPYDSAATRLIAVARAG
jgi:SAM-dependent methyltransferase